MRPKVALVTGASSGIGLGIAKMLATEGYAMTLSSRREERLQPAVESLRAMGANVRGCAANVVHRDDLARLVAQHTEDWGRLDLLVNSAGGGIMGRLDELPEKYVDLQLDLNLRSIINLVKATLGLLRNAATDAGIAQIVNISSIAGKIASRDLSVYSAAKYGVVGFSEALNTELAGEGIRSAVICPEIVDTPLTDYPAFREVMPPEEMIRVEDIAEAVRYLIRLPASCIVPELVFRNTKTVAAGTVGAG